jgi:DNA-binding MurR/RpiR family transcriptional regulator
MVLFLMTYPPPLWAFAEVATQRMANVEQRIMNVVREVPDIAAFSRCKDLAVFVGVLLYSHV